MIGPLRYLLLLLPLLVAGCGNRGKSETKTTGPLGKEVVISDTLLVQGGCDTLRLGRLSSGEQLVLNFHLRNRASTPAVVVGEELTCGCIVLTYEHKPFMPGDYLPVQMQFDSRGLWGWQLKLFRLHLNKGDKPLQIYVEAEIE